MGLAVAAAAAARGLAVTSLDHAACDINDNAALQAAFQELGAGDAVVNAAANLGTAIAESDPLDQFHTNVGGAVRAAFYAQQRNAAIVHFSTDYVFDGTKGSAYVESDPANPVNMYGALKRVSELLVQQVNPNHYVLRISSVYGVAESTTKGPNFADRMLAAAGRVETIEVDDTIQMSPTYAGDAADLTLNLLQARAPFGVYHLSNAGSCTWLTFANAVLELSGSSRRAVPRKTGADPVPRPANSALTSERLGALGLSARDWREALGRYLARDNAAARRANNDGG
jgi:dTDP-4-dehydrorhamnose reductase